MPKTKTDVLHRVPPYRRPIIIIGFVAMVAIVAAIVFAIFSSQSPHQDDSSSTNTSSGSTSVPQTSPGNSTTEPSSEPERPPQYEGQDPNTLDDLTGHIAYRSVNSDTGILTVMVSIDQYLSSDGECTLRLKSGDQELYSETILATADVTTSVCGPFEAPISDLTPGTYQIEIVVSADGKTGTIIDDVQI